MKEETILCVRSSDVRDLLAHHTTRWHAPHHYYSVSFEAFYRLNAWLGPREALEIARPEGGDPLFKQVIPYTVVMYMDEILIYQRKPKNKDQEERLASKWSIGIGGHVNLKDVVSSNGGLPKIDMAATVRSAMWRELVEELVFTDEVRSEEAVGLIVDNSDEVSSVHIGVVNFLKLGNREVKPKSSIGEARWVFRSEIKTFDIENWTKIVAGSIF